MAIYNADDVIRKVQNFLNIRKNWGIDIGADEAYDDLAKALTLATAGNDKMEDFDDAIKFLLIKDWTFGNGDAFKDFEEAIKFYRKEEAKRLRKMAKELEEA